MCRCRRRQPRQRGSVWRIWKTSNTLCRCSFASFLFVLWRHITNPFRSNQITMLFRWWCSLGTLNDTIPRTVCFSFHLFHFNFPLYFPFYIGCSLCCQSSAKVIFEWMRWATTTTTIADTHSSRTNDDDDDGDDDNKCIFMHWIFTFSVYCRIAKCQMENRNG